MRLNPSLFDTIKKDFSHLTFQEADSFKWSPSTSTISYAQDDPKEAEHLLHELSHANLHHKGYVRDIELIAMERDAWEHAKTVLAPKYSLSINADVIDDDLDTYRDWMHARSVCPTCGSNGLQTGNNTYTCVACRAIWKVNRAIGCELRRYKTKPRL